MAMATAKKEKVNTKNKIYIGSRAFDVALIIFMVALSIVFIYPFINIIAISLSSNSMIGSGAVTWYPKEITTKGYEIVFGTSTLYRAYAHTLLYCVGFTLVNLSCTSMIAYSLTQSEFVLRKPVTIILLVTMFFSGGTVPTYLLVRSLGLLDTIWAMILPNAVAAYNVFVYRAFYKGISIELREAARIDGAGEFRILFGIYYPLCKPLFATFGLFSMVGMWNSFYDALLYIKDFNKQPIQLILRQMLFKVGGLSSAMGAAGNEIGSGVQSGALNPKNVQYATIVATIAPIMIIYPFLQKYFTQGMQVGAVKG